jgi:CheY-like chemotaxis protein
MDHMMPGMDGIEASDAIRAIGTEYAKEIPIIALTANAVVGTEDMFYEHGFQSFISKPIDIMELDSVIRKWVRDESQEDTLAVDAPSPPFEGEDITIDIEGVDAEKGLTLYGGEMDIYLPLLRSYAANTPVVLDKLRTVTKETLPGYVIAAHGLKGTSAGIGVEAIREEALNVETEARAGNLDEVLARKDKLIADTEIVVANIRSWLADYDAQNAKPRLKAPSPEVLAKLQLSCEKYDMGGIDKALDELTSFDYEKDGDFVSWIKDKIAVSEITEVAERLAIYRKGQ